MSSETMAGVWQTAAWVLLWTLALAILPAQAWAADIDK